MIKKLFHNRYFLILLVVVLLIGLSVASYSYYQAQNKIKKLSDPQARLEMEKQQVADILKQVGRHIILPKSDEIPTVANINNAEMLAKEQAFYSGAQNGDKVIVYIKSKIAIVYSPERDIIVNMGPVLLNNNENATSTSAISNKAVEPIITPAPTTTQKLPEIISLDIRNGSKVVNGAKNFADSLPTDRYKIDNLGNAVNKNYTENIIVNLNNSDVSDLSSRLKAKVVTDVPAGEATTKSNILVILGGK